MASEPIEEPTDTPDAEPDVTPLLAPRDGVPDLSTTTDEIKAAATLLAGGHGPFAVDAERASGFRYSNRAYLIQIRRAGAGTVLIDPVSHGGDSRLCCDPSPTYWPKTSGFCTRPTRICRASPRSACSRRRYMTPSWLAGWPASTG